jgi:hypothetical protein
VNKEYVNLFRIVGDRSTKMPMHLDEVVGAIIAEYYRCTGANKQKVMSRQKMPCTHCRTMTSTTWRPGPCGTSSLCNACGVMYMVRAQRPRMIDLVISEKRAVWMERTPGSMQWQESVPADLRDPRIQTWRRQEEERNAFVESKKRKYVEM